MALLDEFRRRVLAGETPSRECLIFIASAIDGYLQSGGALGALERDFLRVTPQKGSRLTPAKLLRREPHPDESGESEDQR